MSGSSSRPRSAATSLSVARARLVAPDRRDADPLVAEQELGHRPALVLLADEVLARHPDVLEEDLVDLEAAVDQLDRPQRRRPRSSIGTRIIEMPCCFLGASGSVRTRLKIQSACWPSVVQVFWPLITQSSPSLTRLGGQRGEVGAGVGLGEALAPPDVEVGGLRQELLLHLLRAEVRDHRADHVGVERQRRRHAGQLHLLVPDVALQRRPVLATPLHGPVRYGDPGLVHDLLRLHDAVLADVAAGGDRVAQLLRDLGGEEGPHLLAERGLLLGEGELHECSRGRQDRRDIRAGVRLPRGTTTAVGACGRQGQAASAFSMSPAIFSGLVVEP